MIAMDKEIVKVILLLTGSIQGTKNKVMEFLSGFNKFETLYKDSMQESIKNFTKKNPTLQDYEDILKRYTRMEEEIDKFVEFYKIGAMNLKTENICKELKNLCSMWKQSYSQDLHKRAR